MSIPDARVFDPTRRTAADHQVQPVFEPTADTASQPKRSILHVCTREVLRPVRDQILRGAGYDVISCDTHDEALEKARGNRYDLVLVDIDAQHHVRDAERLCSEVKQADATQRVAFVCNWRVAILNECPDDIVRSEFDPIGFLSGVADAFNGDGNHKG